LAPKVNSALLLSLLGGICSIPLSLFFFGPAPIIAVGCIFGASFPAISVAIAGLVSLAWMGGTGALSYLALTGIPSALAVKLSISRRGSFTTLDIGRAIADVSIFGLCIILFLSIDLFGLGSKTENYVENSFQIFFTQFQSHINAAADQHQSEKVSLALSALGKFAAQISVGTLGAASFLILAVNVSLVETLTNKIGLSNLTRPNYTMTQPPAWLSVIFFGMIALSLSPGDLGKFGLNCAIFLSFPFILIGLAVIHSVTRNSRNEKVALCGFYMLVFVIGVIFGLLAFIAIILALAGAFECWFGVRQRLRKSSPD